MTDTPPPPETVDELPDEVKQVVYDELGQQIEKMDAVVESFEENGITHIDAFDVLNARRAHLCTMRGYLNHSADSNLRESTDSPGE